MPDKNFFHVNDGTVLVIPNKPNSDETERLYDMYVVVESANLEYFTSHFARVASLNPEDEGTRWEIHQDHIQDEDCTRITLRYYSEADGTSKNPAPADKVYPYRPLRYKTRTIYPRVEAANKIYALLTCVDKLPYNTDLTLCIHTDTLRSFCLRKPHTGNYSTTVPIKNAQRTRSYDTSPIHETPSKNYWKKIRRYSTG